MMQRVLASRARHRAIAIDAGQQQGEGKDGCETEHLIRLRQRESVLSGDQL